MIDIEIEAIKILGTEEKKFNLLKNISKFFHFGVRIVKNAGKIS